MLDEWKEWYSTKQEWLTWHTDGLAELCGAAAEEGEYKLEEVEIEETVANTEEVIRT